MRAHRAAHHDHKAGQREQRDSSASSATRRAEVAVHEREHRQHGQPIPHDERQLADEQRGDGRKRAKPAPPGKRAHHPP